MERINTTNKAVDLFGAGKHGFQDGNPGTGVFATFLSAAIMNSLQEELANLIENAGIVLSGADRTQVRQAIQKMIVDAQKTLVIPNVTLEASVADGEVVRWDAGNNRFDEAISDATANERGLGIADVSNSKVYVYGETPAIFSGLTPGAEYYLSDVTPGAITSVRPARAIKVGVAKSATVLWVDVDNLSAQSASDTAPGLIEIAVDSEMESGLDFTRAVPPGRQHRHPSAVKFWIKGDGAAATNNASYNVTGTTDHDAGTMGVSIATDFSTADWCAHYSTLDTNQRSISLDNSGTYGAGQAAGSCITLCIASSGAPTRADPSKHYVSGLGDQ